jgi:hypothetical protein
LSPEDELADALAGVVRVPKEKGPILSISDGYQRLGEAVARAGYTWLDGEFVHTEDTLGWRPKR